MARRDSAVDRQNRRGACPRAVRRQCRRASTAHRRLSGRPGAPADPQRERTARDEDAGGSLSQGGYRFPREGTRCLNTSSVGRRLTFSAVPKCFPSTTVDQLVEAGRPERTAQGLGSVGGYYAQCGRSQSVITRERQRYVLSATHMVNDLDDLSLRPQLTVAVSPLAGPDLGAHDVRFVNASWPASTRRKKSASWIEAQNVASPSETRHLLPSANTTLIGRRATTRVSSTSTSSPAGGRSKPVKSARSTRTVGAALLVSSTESTPSVCKGATTSRAASRNPRSATKRSASRGTVSRSPSSNVIRTSPASTSLSRYLVRELASDGKASEHDAHQRRQIEAAGHGPAVQEIEHRVGGALRDDEVDDKRPLTIA